MSAGGIPVYQRVWFVWLLTVLTLGLYTPIWYLINRSAANDYYDRSLSTHIKHRERVSFRLLIVYFICYLVGFFCFIFPGVLSGLFGISTGPVKSGGWEVFLYIFLAIALPCAWFMLMHCAADAVHASFLIALFWSSISLLILLVLIILRELGVFAALTQVGANWLVLMIWLVSVSMIQVGSLGPLYFQYKINRTPGLQAA